MSQDLWRLSAVELGRGIRDRQYTAVEVVESVLGRMAALNPHLNAITFDCSEDARVAAREADAALARGSDLGPLHGVPVTIKENVDQRGKPTPNGIPAFADLIAPEDAPVVANLRRAGAIIIGRTNTPELSMRATTDNPLRGRTRNPWSEDASPGGSSGGAGVAAAVGFGPLHHGNDIGGSLRFPSFACGVMTVKPTQGRVPAYNPSAAAERGLLAQLMSVQGPIARTVADLRLALGVMAQGDPRDPWWVPVALQGWPDEGPVRVAVTRESYGYPMHPEVRAAIDRAAGCLEAGGYRVEEVATPSMLEAASGWFDVATYEIKETLGPVARQVGSETLQRIFDWYYTLGNMVDADGYRLGIAERTRLTRAWSLFLQQYPLVLSPFLMRPNFSWNYDAQDADSAHDVFKAALYSVGVNYLGLPAGVLPVGKVAGLPAGVQIIGRRFREDLILDAMAVIESRVERLTDELWTRLDAGIHAAPAEAANRADRAHREGSEPWVSIVIPVLNDGAALGRLLAELQPVQGLDVEIIVVDGGSVDDAQGIAREAGCTVVMCPPGRGGQLAEGVAQARGLWIWLLHADSRNVLDALRSLLDRSQRPGWGRFRIAFADGPPLLRLVAAMMNLRSRLSGICTGDQGIFAHRDLLRACGGIPRQSLMEDIELSRRLKRLAAPHCRREVLTTSARRWRSRGLIRTIVDMWYLRLRYWLGADPEVLAREYYG